VKGKEAVSGEAIVTIRDRQWSVSIASTPWELAQGLRGIAETLPGTGMLFDTGWEQYVTVTTEGMLFPLDIAFFSESLEVVDLVRHLAPGQKLTSTLPARYFLEVNAEEMDSIDLGDVVSIEIVSLQEVPVIPDWKRLMFSFIGFALMSFFMMSVTRPVFKTMLGSSVNPGRSANSSGVNKRYHGAYLTNWQYGGYSYVEEDPERPEHRRIRGMVDYANPEDVIAIAEREKLPYVALAGGFWEHIGHRGWGEKVSIAEAKKALAQAKEHISGRRQSSSPRYVWLRLGDIAEHEKFDSPHEAGEAVGERLSLHPEEYRPPSFRYRSAGVDIEPYFIGNNYVSLFWGDADAQWIRDLTDDEKREFERGVREAIGATPIEQPSRDDVSVESFVERGYLAKSNPGHPPRTSDKIKARSITLQRAEGTIGRDDFGPKTVTAKEGGNVWEQADRLLFDWSQTAPRGGGYDKVDFTVNYEDGETYSGRYDLVHWSEEYPSLAKEVLSKCV